MKINEAYLSGAAPSQIQQTQQTAGAAPARSETSHKPAASPTDSVGLSELSVRLLELSRAEPPERAARLERLAAEVRSGRYQVDPLALSRRLIDDALEGPS